MRLERSQALLMVSMQEVTVANFVPRRAVRASSNAHESWMKVDPPRPRHGRFPTEGVAFRVVRQEGGPFRLGDEPEPNFPLRFSQLTPDASAYQGTQPRPRAKQVTAGGQGYTVYAWIGPTATTRDRAALKAVVSSLSFPHLRPGTQAGHFVVLDTASAYPVGSFTRVHAEGQPFYLVHAPGGFYGISWSDYTSGGYRPRCALQVDVARQLFSCPQKRYGWNRMGQPALFPQYWKPYPLKVSIAKVSWDGHVLLAPGVDAYGDRTLAKRLWSPASPAHA